MTRLRKAANWAAFLIVLLTLFAFTAGPALVRWRIQTTHPDVTVYAVFPRLGGVALTHVRVHREWLDLDSPEALVRWDGSVEFLGGEANLDLTKRPKGGGDGSGGRVVTGLLDKVSVSDDGKGATLKGVILSHEGYAFRSADFVTAHVSGHADYITAMRDQSRVTVKNMALKVSLPFTIPAIQGGDMAYLSADAVFVGAEDVVVRPKERVAEAAAARVSSTAFLDLFIVKPHVDLNDSVSVLSAESLGTADPRVFSQFVTSPPIRVTFDRAVNSVGFAFGSATLAFRMKDHEVYGDDLCQTFVNSLPHEMREGPLADAHFTGNLSFEAGIHPPHVTLSGTCKASCDAPSLQALRKAFEYTAWSSDGAPMKRTSGPGSKDWTSIRFVNPDMPAAAIRMEDPGYMGHHGYITQAFENSLIDNMKSGRFVRGGSTITMQTAKNLWLTRHKSFGRKVQEVFLSQALESCFSKSEILELYLNIVEYGPDLYGIGPAAEHYFHTLPYGLTTRQAYYLASILPRPRKAPPPTEATMDRIARLMEKLGRADADAGDGDTAGWEANP